MAFGEGQSIAVHADGNRLYNMTSAMMVAVVCTQPSIFIAYILTGPIHIAPINVDHVKYTLLPIHLSQMFEMHVGYLDATAVIYLMLASWHVQGGHFGWKFRWMDHQSM